jgi:transposase
LLPEGRIRNGQPGRSGSDKDTVMGKKHTMKATDKNEKKRYLQGLPVVEPNVAGIDLGSEEHWACAPTQDGTAREVVRFGGTTSELMRMAEWLKERKVKSVAMESTGVYWIAPFEVLEGQGLEVLLVDTRQLAQVPGRDRVTDPSASEWLQRLHSCGLLRGAHRPQEEIVKLRTLVRDKSNLVAECGDWVRRMQKSLDQMNVRLHRAVSDIDGITGMKILEAIVAGERDPMKLAEMRDPRCKNSVEEIAEQLRGHWREDHLFSLEQSLKMYKAARERIGAYEAEILKYLKKMEPEEQRKQTAPPLKNSNKAKAIEKRGQEEKRQVLFRVTGVDMTQIDAIGVETVETVVSEYGADLRQFPTEKQFVSHVTLAPHYAKSGKSVKKRKRNSSSTRAAAALRMAALSLRNSKTALGAYYRRIAQRLGGDVAVFSTARKLAVLIYRLLRWGQQYIDEGVEAYEARYREMRTRRMQAAAKEMGYQLVPLNA